MKTRQFGEDKYVGDPINAVKIFNEKSVDELIVLDIDTSKNGVEPDYKLIKKLADESRMPLCYGGGVKSVEQVQRIIQLGVEKVALSSALLEAADLATRLSEVVGRQSVVAVLDVKKSFLKGYEVYVGNGKVKVTGGLLSWLESLQTQGVGEFLINSIDRDGMQGGYDLSLAKLVKENVSVPVTFLGGASSLDDIGNLIETVGLVGCAAGSLFVFKGKYRAVLINYPSFDEKFKLITERLMKYEQS